jgi:competence protein ComEC
VGFTAGVFAGLSFPGLAWLGMPLAALAAAALWRSRRRASLACLALAWGGAWGALAADGAAATCATRWREGERVAVVVEAWDLADPGGRSRVRVSEPAACQAVLVALWPRGEGPPSGRAVVVASWHRGAPRWAAWWPARPGAGGRLVVRRVHPLPESASLRSRVRQLAERRLVTLFGAQRFPLVSALTLGSSDQLEAALRQQFARAGLAHILAISGLHVAILAAALIGLLRGAGVAPARARLCAVPAVAAYVWLLGMPPPAVRSAWLLLVWEAARARQRPPLRSGVLAVTALGVAALDPFAVSEVGPWLSFAGAWGAAEGARWWAALRWPERWREARLFGIGEMVAVSLGATLATAPISGLTFGSVSTAAVVTNLVAVPTVGIAVPLLAGALGASLVFAPLARVSAAAAGLALDLLERIAAWGSGLPLATVSVTDRAGTAAVLLLVLWLWRRLALPRRRSPYPRIVRWRLATAGVALGAAAIWWPVAPRLGPGDRPGWMTIHFLAVGQGDAAAIRTPVGRWLLVDGGPRERGQDAGARIVVPFLRGRGVGRLAAVVASHGEADHLGGLPAVLAAIPADLALEPGDALGSRVYRDWLASLVRGGVRWHPARAGDSLVADGVVVRVLHPDSAWLARGLSPNENAVVVRVEFGSFRALLAGDAGLPMEAARAGDAGWTTVLKVSHHGSRSATGPSWLTALTPSICVVSVGVNRFGHPAPDVLRRLDAAGCRTYRTDEAGTVSVSTDGRSVVVQTRDGRDSSAVRIPRGSP